MRTIAIKDQITLTYPGLSGYLANLPAIQLINEKWKQNELLIEEAITTWIRPNLP